MCFYIKDGLILESRAFVYYYVYKHSFCLFVGVYDLWFPFLWLAGSRIAASRVFSIFLIALSLSDNHERPEKRKKKGQSKVLQDAGNFITIIIVYFCLYLFIYFLLSVIVATIRSTIMPKKQVTRRIQFLTFAARGRGMGGGGW